MLLLTQFRVTRATDKGRNTSTQGRQKEELQALIMRVLSKKGLAMQLHPEVHMEAISFDTGQLLLMMSQ